MHIGRLQRCMSTIPDADANCQCWNAISSMAQVDHYAIQEHAWIAMMGRQTVRITNILEHPIIIINHSRSGPDRRQLVGNPWNPILMMSR